MSLPRHDTGPLHEIVQPLTSAPRDGRRVYLVRGGHVVLVGRWIGVAWFVEGRTLEGEMSFAALPERCFGGWVDAPVQPGSVTGHWRRA